MHCPNLFSLRVYSSGREQDSVNYGSGLFKELAADCATYFEKRSANENDLCFIYLLTFPIPLYTTLQ